MIIRLLSMEKIFCMKQSVCEEAKSKCEREKVSFEFPVPFINTRDQ
jgi:hypothetical protein